MSNGVVKNWLARVRMYRQGLGDCFLITFAGTAKPVHLLIDCGVFRGTSEATARMGRVADHILETTRDSAGTPRLDLLVVTHEHWDHLSGFIEARQQFDALEIGRIWLGWTEDPANPVAVELQQKHSLKLKALALALDQLKTTQPLAATRPIEALLDFYGGSASAFAFSPKTREALDYVKGRTDAVIEYCYPGNETLVVPGLDSVRFYVLGPPENLKLLRKDAPSKSHPEVYEIFSGTNEASGFYAAIRAASATGMLLAPEDEERRLRTHPFDSQYRIEPEAARRQAFFKKTYYRAQPDEAWRRIDRDWLGAAAELALQLDSDTNNSSLALAIEFVPSGKVLLFPGDAQVGNWLSWETLTWPMAGGNGPAQTVTATDLLKRTVLYKVGHHGSHNATLRDKGLELMTSPNLVALLPVDETFAREKQHWNMPFPALYQRLEEKTRGRILRADKGWPLSTHSKPALLAAAQWKAFKRRAQVDPGGLFVDFYVT